MLKERFGLFVGDGTLRASVMGINDGLVSNFSLVMGVAGGTTDTSFVMLAGIAGLLAGAFSMAAGEYVSMTSQRDAYEHLIGVTADQLRNNPDEKGRELMRIYQSKGFQYLDALRISKHIISRPDVALETIVREQLGLDPKQLGSPWGASISSFVSFVSGAIVPILPYLLTKEESAFALSTVLSAGALIIVGGTLSKISGRNIVWGGLRMFIAGIAAASVTFFIGRMIGTAWL